MKQNYINKGIISENSTGIGAVTRAMVHKRARELAEIGGRIPPEVSQADYEQAKRELTGETDLDRQDALIDSIPETKRWDPVPGSEGHQTLESPSEDEDDEGRSETEQLVNEGAEEAERDLALQAVRAAAKRDAEGR